MKKVKLFGLIGIIIGLLAFFGINLLKKKK